MQDSKETYIVDKDFQLFCLINTIFKEVGLRKQKKKKQISQLFSILYKNGNANLCENPSKEVGIANFTQKLIV